MFAFTPPPPFSTVPSQVSQLCRGFLQPDPSRRCNAADGLGVVGWLVSCLESSAEERDRSIADDDSTTAATTAASAATAATSTATGVGTGISTATASAATTTAATAAGVTAAAAADATTTATIASTASTTAAAAAGTAGTVDTVVGDDLRIGAATANAFGTATAPAGTAGTVTAVTGDGLPSASPAGSCQGIGEKRSSFRPFAEGASGGGGGDGARPTRDITAAGDDKRDRSSSSLSAVDVKPGRSATVGRVSREGEDRLRELDALVR